MTAIHGTNLLPVLTGKTPTHRDEVFSEMDAIKMVRRGNWKYIYHPGWDKAQLFNLEDDPRELKNLSGAADVAELERDLHNRLLDWMIETEARPNSSARA